MSSSGGIEGMINEAISLVGNNKEESELSGQGYQADTIVFLKQHLTFPVSSQRLQANLQLWIFWLGKLLLTFTFTFGSTNHGFQMILRIKSIFKDYFSKKVFAVKWDPSFLY